MKKASLDIFDCIVSLNEHNQKAYSTTIRTILRGSVGPVSVEFSNKSFFGSHVGIKPTEIERYLKELCNIEKLFRITNTSNGRIYYETKPPKHINEIDEFSKVKTKTKKSEIHDDIDDMIDEMFS